MEVRVEPFDDRSEPDEHGFYEYIYVGTNLHFSEDGEPVTFRLDDDEPGVATLVAPPGWRPDVYAGALFRDAIAYMRERRAVEAIHVHHPGGKGFRPLNEAVDAARQLGLKVPPDDTIRDLGVPI